MGRQLMLASTKYPRPDSPERILLELEIQISGEYQRAHLGCASYHGRINRDPSIKCGTTPGRFDLPTFLRLRTKIDRRIIDRPPREPPAVQAAAGDFQHADLCLPHRAWERALLVL